MCGIIGYAGSEQAAPILLRGLETLEYRGYDSAGLAVMSGGVINIQKCRGRLSFLAAKTDGGQNMEGAVGIGHTRWATHGEPSDINSHPHLSQSGKFAVVHNGIIENYRELKDRLERYGYTFQSETDTEVIAHLVEYCDCGDLIRTIAKVLQRIEGSYALGVLSTAEPERLVAVRKDSPLVVCRNDRAGYIASDIPALLSYSRDMYLMEDNEIVSLTPTEINFFNIDARPIQKDIYHVDWDVAAAEKGGYEHFMLKEIYEQPQALQQTAQSRIHEDGIRFEGIDYSTEYVSQLTGVHVVACGSAYHAGLVGRHMIEAMLQRPVNVEIASEFRYRNPLVGAHQLVIAVSQSGETADTLAALREAKRRGARTLAIVNVVGSSLAREADDVIYTWAGPEISVATTKGYTTQLLTLGLVAIYLGQQ
ncbi:MAG TPA: glutamine--fructose-6-phosphate transaminase (isomerizing), partial [Clostridiaceae bacterium]|nr:glutamine--fructose-6-phosphate transaminase (isomerizing) [Clostridiaceae bacterium]